ncbi:MAG TPA: uroporphyrinogen-III synthase, partial [Actinobacteria bacterium]|nr:uroporphyrinogen-III synthase [Actinomycetota bacterium]
SELVEIVENLGAEAIEFPTIKIVPPKSYDELDNAIKKILNSRLPTPDSRPSYDWIIFTSVNGVNYFVERLYCLGTDIRDLKGIKIAAIGPATARKLKDLGLKIDYIPSDYRAESIIEGLKDKVDGNTKILVPRAKVAREILPEKLREFGAKVEVVTAYQTIIDGSCADKIKEMFKKREVDIVTFTSSSTVKNFVELLKDINLENLLKSVTIASIGPITSKTAEELGLKVDISAKEYTIKGLAEAIVSSYQLSAASCRVEE